MNFLQKNRMWLGVTAGVLVLFGGFLWWRSNAMNEANTGLEAEKFVMGRLENPVSKGGENYWLPPEELIESGLDAEDVPAIDTPKFISVAEAESLLGDDLYGIDLEINGLHRFYPVQILNWHYVVNDEWQGQSFAVSYDPLTFSSSVYDRKVGDKTLTFEYAGKVFSNIAVLRDRETGTEWLQLTGLGIHGKMLESGQDGEIVLERMTSTFMKWGDWKTAFPEGSVLSSETSIARDYTRHPYGAYDTANTIYFPVTRTNTALDAKWRVDGIGDVAFSWKILEGTWVQNETANGSPVVAFYDTDLNTVRVFSRAVTAAQADLNFIYDPAKKEIRDSETSSVWSEEGLALSGSLQGTQLQRVNSRTCFWFAWSAVYPESRVAGVEIIPAPTNE